ncbi:MAG: hypothetical protein JO306_07595 [Gemmatimonadetes bacterium]|nr:hypothetical protein [Gemmatimonadota bacterium]
MKEIIREVDASPDDVLAAVREDAREWRESAIPPALRKRGIVRVEARIRPPYVELRFRLNASDRNAGTAILRAAVIAAPGGGARIRGEYGRGSGELLGCGLVLAAFVALAWTATDATSALVASAFAFMNFVFMLVPHLGPRGRPDVEADYLMQRFEHALAVAEGKALPKPAITPARRP